MKCAWSFNDVCEAEAKAKAKAGATPSKPVQYVYISPCAGAPEGAVHPELEFLPEPV